MKMIPSRIVACLSGALLCIGCSVKENRDLCPCRLVLDFREVDSDAIRSVDLYLTADDGFVFTDNVAAEDYEEEYVVSVPRNGMHLGVWSGDAGATPEAGLIVPLGSDCPEVYMYSSDISTYSEELHENVVMRKMHCRMTINIKGKEVLPASLVLLGNVCGYDKEGKPVAGEFEYEAYPQNGVCKVILPRQIDDSLVMEINDGSAVLKRFALGNFIVQSGYDWNAPDLEDIEVDLDFAATYLKLTIQGWEGEQKFDVVI